MMNKEQEFNQQEYNKEMKEQLLAHGFEETREGSQIYDCSWNIAEKRIRVSLHNHFPINILFYHDANLKAIVKHNHSMDWIKEQAKFYLGIDLVKKEEKEPLKCTLENAWKGRRKYYYIDNHSQIVGNYRDSSEHPKNRLFSCDDTEKLQLLPKLFNLIRFANEQFPAEGGQQTRYFSPFFRFRGELYQLYYSTTETPTHPFIFASQKAFDFFSAEPENVELLKKVLTPNF